jgi:hypothetical protein
MSDDKRSLVRFWLSLVVAIASWAAWKFSNGALAAAGAMAFCCLNLAYAFRVARRIRSTPAPTRKT